MKNTITTESANPGNGSELVIEVDSDAHIFSGDHNICFTKTGYEINERMTFCLDAKAARALSFALGELAKELGRNK